MEHEQCLHYDRSSTVGLAASLLEAYEKTQAAKCLDGNAG
jgi:hypothetical protein